MVAALPAPFSECRLPCSSPAPGLPRRHAAPCWRWRPAAAAPARREPATSAPQTRTALAGTAAIVPAPRHSCAALSALMINLGPADQPAGMGGSWAAGQTWARCACSSSLRDLEDRAPLSRISRSLMRRSSPRLSSLCTCRATDSLHASSMTEQGASTTQTAKVAVCKCSPQAQPWSLRWHGSCSGMAQRAGDVHAAGDDRGRHAWPTLSFCAALEAASTAEQVPPNARQSQKPRCASPLFRLSLGPAVSAQLFAWDSAACRIVHAAGNDRGRRAWRTFSFCAALEAASSALPSLACVAALRAPGLLSLCRDQSLCQWTAPHALWSSLRALAALLGCLAECLHLQLLPGDITET